MISFLRKLRKENGTGIKYFRYAIGEIILVVIGILIALQINNWNEYRKDRIKEQGILRQLKEEYKSNLAQLESKINIRNRMKASGQRLLHYMNNPEGVGSDSILYHFSQTGYRPTFDPIKNDIVGTDKLSLIQNDSLRVLLSQWETSFYQLNEEEWFWRDFVINVRLPFQIDQHLSRKTSYASQQNFRRYFRSSPNALSEDISFEDTNRPIDFRRLLDVSELEAISVAAVFSGTDANLISTNLKATIETILKLIDQELDP